MRVWAEPFTALRLPKLFDLRADPYERADITSNTYYDWIMSHAFMIYEMQEVVAKQIEDFAKFPPRQKPASFNLDQVMEELTREKPMRIKVPVVYDGAPPIEPGGTTGR